MAWPGLTWPRIEKGGPVGRLYAITYTCIPDLLFHVVDQMSDTQLAAIIGMLGALLGALLTAVAQPLITARLSSRPRITVQIKKSNFSLPQLISKFVRQNRDDAALKSISNNLRLASTFYELTLQNSGKVTCKNIVLNFHSDAICQVGKPELFDERDYEANIIRNIRLGDMQPGQKFEVLVWSSFSPLFGNPLSVTADDLHDVKYETELLQAKPKRKLLRSALWIVLISLIINLILRKTLG